MSWNRACLDNAKPNLHFEWEEHHFGTIAQMEKKHKHKKYCKKAQINLHLWIQNNRIICPFDIN